MKFRNIWVIAAMMFAILPFSYGQVTGASIRGQVLDPQGAAVVDAAVTLVNVGTGLELKSRTNSTGEYLVQAIPPGAYRLTVDSPGFKKFEQSGIQLTIGQSAAVNATLSTGDVSETVSVVGDAELINTTTAEVSQVVDKTSIQELPLNGRDPASLVLLSPGTSTITLTNAGYNQTFSGFATEQGASSNGGKQGSTYYMLDGAPNNDIYMMLAAPFPNADATQEFKVETNNFDAQYGFSPAAVVSIQTRTGTNQIHGEAFEFVRNQDLDAANFFTKQVDTLKRNQFGGSVGGPILHDKLFYFANYQGTREVYANNAQFDTSLTAAMRTGDFSAVSYQLNDPTTGQPFPLVNGVANQIPYNRLNQDALNFAKNLPVAPAGGDGDFYVSQPKVGDSYDEGTGRLDYDINTANRVSLRYFSNFFLQPGSTGGGSLLQSMPEEQTHYLNFLLSDTWTINPSTINVANVYESTENALEIPDQKDTSGSPICLSKYAAGLNEPAGDCNVQGFQLSGATGGYEYVYQITNAVRRSARGFGDTLIKTVNRHTLTAGGTFLRNFDQDSSDWESIAQDVFYGNATGFGPADLALGLMTSFSQGGGEYGEVHGWQLGLFAQDQYQIRPNLTLNAGVRWEPLLPPAIVAGRAASYIPGEQSAVFPNAPAGDVFAGDPGVGAGVYSADYRVFQPRLGIAWQPKRLPNTSIRTAFGFFSEPLPLSNYNHMYDNAPFSPTYYFASGGWYGLGFVMNNNVATFDNPWASVNFPGGNSPFPPFSSATYVPSKNVAFSLPLGNIVTLSPTFKPATVQSWNFSIAHQIRKDLSLEATYVGIETSHDNVQNEVNPGVYANDGARINPSFSSVSMTQSIGTASYNALQVHVQKAMSHGLQAGSSFTWARTIDDSPYSSITWGNRLTNPFNLRANRSEAILNIPLISVTNFMYTAPALNSNAIVKNTIGGWELTGIMTFQSGTPFSVMWTSSADYSEAHTYEDRADLSGVPLKIKQGSRSNWLQAYYNPSAFQVTAPGTFGTSAQNMIHGPGINTADMAASKNWSFENRYRLQFRWEAFNAFNHTNFGNPGNVIKSGGGKITSTGPIAPRLMQAGMKLYF